MNLLKSLLALFGIFVLVGCQSSQPTATLSSVTETVLPEIELIPTNMLTSSPTPAPTEPDFPIPTELPTLSATPLPPTQTTEPTTTPNHLPEGVEVVTITTKDGFNLAGFLHTPKNPETNPIGVVLSHEYYSTHHSWEWLAEQLADEGFTTLTFDARGHGKSPGTKFYDTAGIDTKAAVEFLNEQGFEQIICLGTSMGGSGCLIAAVEMDLAGFAMLSSPMDIGRLRLISHQDLKSLAIPKILMIAEEDRVGPDFVAAFIETVDLSSEPKEYYLYPGDLHASELFYADFGKEVQEILFNFVTGFSQSFQEPSPTIESPTLVFSLTAADCASTGLPKIACTGVLTNDDWAPTIREFNGIPMVLVPAGCFMMGSTDEQIEYYLTLLDRRRLFENEQPAHQQCFAEPFWIDLYEVTNGYYGSYGLWQHNDQPRESLTWPEANAYCQDRGGRPERASIQILCRHVIRPGSTQTPDYDDLSQGEFVGGYLAIKGRLDLGALVAFISAQEKIYDPWKELIAFYQVYQDASVRYKRTMEYFDEVPEHTLEPDDREPYELEGSIEVKDLSFLAEGGIQLLDGINLSLQVQVRNLDLQAKIIPGIKSSINPKPKRNRSFSSADDSNIMTNR